MRIRWWKKKREAKEDEEKSNLGNILLLMGAINEQQLRRAADERQRREDIKIGKIFVEQGAITTELLYEALRLQAEMREGRRTEAMLSIVEEKTRAHHRRLFPNPAPAVAGSK